MYRGRFAPSPTGPMHLGSLIASVGSYLEARSRQGEWLVRMEDLDAPRTMPGAADDILRTLEAFGFEWDGAVLYQSNRTEAYRAEFQRLERQGLTYPCACSRKEIADSIVNRPRFGDLTYPGTCRTGLPPRRRPRSWRIRTPDRTHRFTDKVQGICTENLAESTGDFILLRADGYYSYQLAVVVDDAEQQITDIMRGADLLDSTARQIYLQAALGYLTPEYAHLPVATNREGEKLSKQTRAQPVAIEYAAELIVKALCFLKQQPPKLLAREPLPEVWRWAIEHWQLTRVPSERALDVSALLGEA